MRTDVSVATNEDKIADSSALTDGDVIKNDAVLTLLYFPGLFNLSR